MLCMLHADMAGPPDTSTIFYCIVSNSAIRNPEIGIFKCELRFYLTNTSHIASESACFFHRLEVYLLYLRPSNPAAMKFLGAEFITGIPPPNFEQDDAVVSPSGTSRLHGYSPAGNQCSNLAVAPAKCDNTFIST